MTFNGPNQYKAYKYRPNDHVKSDYSDFTKTSEKHFTDLSVRVFSCRTFQLADRIEEAESGCQGTLAEEHVKH